MQIRVLGPVDVVDDEGNNQALRGPMPARLLALLVAGRSGEIAVDDLAIEMWSDSEQPADPVAALRTVVARVRAALGPDAIVTGTGTYSLGELDSDVGRFEDIVERARRSSGSPAVADMWSHALDLWRGPAFGDHSSIDSIRREAGRLDELRAEATEAWFDARLAAGEGRELVGDVEAAADEFPLREGFRAQQMTVLARVGRQAEALRAYQDFRSDLTDIGLEPSERLVELEGQIAVGDVPRSGARRTLRGYELGERLGEGAFAIVHAARQASVDRPVAIKQIRSDLADQPEFIRQFEAEAHLVARLEHPHIVPLYDYWREPGSAYLVMRHLEGGSLQDQLHEGALELDELVPVVSQVAAGLDEAHHAGVIHRDVKPANILLDTAGNGYLSDFGIAVEEAERLDPEAWLSHGSPAYAPPEQLRRELVGPSADVYALGVTTYEALTAQLPFAGEITMAGLLERQLNDPVPLARTTHPHLPAAIDTVIQKATAKQQGDRYQTAGAFAADLAIAAGLQGDEVLIESQDRNPYKGLAAFDEADANDFTGREQLTAKLVSSVANSRAVMVVGPSGSGKSSAVRAGLLPRLRDEAIAGSGNWFITAMTPGLDPFADLEAALLRVAVDPPADLIGELRSGPDGLARAIRQVVPDDGEILLVVDQMEELFTLAATSDRDPLVESLVTALGTEDSRLRMVATIRADFYDHPLRHPALAELVSDATVSVRPLAANELERAITEPARAVGATFEPGLVAQITADIADQPGALPLLQYALTELYDRRVDETMLIDAYNQLGGVTGALARRAEEVFIDLDQEARDTVQSVFTRLVSLGDGTEDTRRRVLRNELGDSTRCGTVLEHFGKARLLAFDRDAATREPTVEVAHEALIREWPRLRGWLDDDRDGLRTHRHLTESSTNWDQRGRESSELYRGGRLEAAEEWVREQDGQLNPNEESFLHASLEARSQSEAEEAARLQAEQQSNRRLRQLLVGVAVVAAMALVAGVVAFQQRDQANRSAEQATRNAERAEEQTLLADEQTVLATENADLAVGNAATTETERIAAQAASRVDDNPQLALLLAAETYNRDPGPTGLGALQETLSQTDNFLGIVGAGVDFVAVEWLDDSTLVGVGPDGTYSIDIDGRTVEKQSDFAVARRNESDGVGNTAIPSPLAAIDAPLVAGFDLGRPCCLTVFNMSSGTLVQSELDHPDSVMAVAAHSATGLVLTLGNGGTLRAFDADTLELRWEIDAFPEQVIADFELPDWVDLTTLVDGWDYGFFQVRMAGLWIAPDGASVVTAAAYATRSFDTASGLLVGEQIATEIPDSEAPFPYFPRRVIYGPDGDALVASPFDIITDGQRVEVETTGAFFGLPNFVAVEPLDNERLVVQFTDRRAAVVDLSSGSISGLEFDLPLPAPGRMALSSSGQTVAVPSSDGVGLWSLKGDGLAVKGLPRLDARTGSITATGNEIMVGGAQYRIFPTGRIGPRRIVVDSGELLPYDDTAEPYQLRAVDDASFMSWSQRDYRIRLHSQETGEVLAAYGPQGVNGIDFHPASGQIAMATPHGLRIFDLAAGGQATQVLDNPAFSSSVTFSADGGRVGAADAWSRVPRIWDLASGELTEDGSSFEQDVVTMRFSPDGRYLVTLSSAGVFTVRDPDTYLPIRDLLGARVELLKAKIWFSADGRYLLSGARRMWDVETGEQIGGTFPNDSGFGLGGNDGLQLVTAADDDFLAVWNLNLDEWFDIACQAAGRNMTRDEWEQFGPADADYRATCPQWPIES